MKVNFFRYCYRGRRSLASPAFARRGTSDSYAKIVIILFAVGVVLSTSLNQGQQAIASNSARDVYQTTQAFTAEGGHRQAPASQAGEPVTGYKPKYFVVLAHDSNYGDRYSTDVNGNVVDNQAIAVLHETTNSARSALNTFRTPHYQDSKQVSYHAIIALNGTIIYTVPSDKRAFGAGNSVFKSPSGVETVQTNPNLPPSVNNFAYHISLETPVDGRNSNASYHSGYTEDQYKSLAWLIALSNIPDERITTHKNVDRSGNRFDPRSFDFDKFFSILHSYRQPTS